MSGTPDQSTFGRRVRQLRQTQHATLAEVAALAGLSTERLAALESGQVDAVVDEAFLLADALGVHVTALFTNPGDRLSPNRRGTAIGTVSSAEPVPAGDAAGDRGRDRDHGAGEWSRLSGETSPAGGVA